MLRAPSFMFRSGRKKREPLLLLFLVVLLSGTYLAHRHHDSPHLASIRSSISANFPSRLRPLLPGGLSQYPAGADEAADQTPSSSVPGLEHAILQPIEPEESSTSVALVQPTDPSGARELALGAFSSFISSHHSVAVFDHNGFHDEVHGAVLWSLSQFPDLDIRFYRGKWRYKFEDTISNFWTEPPRSPKLFIDDLRNDTSIRHIVMTTCDWDWYRIDKDLLDVWDERAEEDKFDITCIRHFNQEHIVRDLSVFLGRGGQMTQVGLGDHVTAMLRRNRDRAIDWLGQWKGDEIVRRQEGLRVMKIESFVPVFPAQIKSEPGDKLFEDQQARAPEDEDLKMAIIQSTSWDDDHRNLKGMYADLRKHFEADPRPWGYDPPTNKTRHYTPIPDHPSRFKLYLVGGSKGHVPKEFQAVVLARVGYSYPKFYGALHASDLVLPAFGNTRYDKDRASSTMGVAATARAPLLVPQSYVDAYGYFCPSFGILRPDNVTEIDYIAGVRKGEYSWLSRKGREDELIKCQEDWTSRNMYTLADLFGLL